jgi:hypothetical protein
MSICLFFWVLSSCGWHCYLPSHPGKWPAHFPSSPFLPQIWQITTFAPRAWRPLPPPRIAVTTSILILSSSLSAFSPCVHHYWNTLCRKWTLLYPFPSPTSQCLLMVLKIRTLHLRAQEAQCDLTSVQPSRSPVFIHFLARILRSHSMALLLVTRSLVIQPSSFMFCAYCFLKCSYISSLVNSIHSKILSGISPSLKSILWKLHSSLREWSYMLSGIVCLLLP